MATHPVEFPERPLRLDVNSTNDGVTTVACNGRLTSETSESFKTQVKSLIPRGRRIVLDLTNLSYMDSSGLGALVSVYASAKHGDVELKLINLSARIQQLLRLTKLASVFEPFGENL
jgi:anti-sigma B factor antagonist